MYSRHQRKLISFVLVGLLSSLFLAYFPPRVVSASNLITKTAQDLPIAFLPMLRNWAVQSNIIDVNLQELPSVQQLTPEISHGHLKFLISASNLETQGQKNYLLGEFSQAITLWQQAAIAYGEKHEVLNQVRVLSNLALAYHQLGQDIEANKFILSGRSLLETQKNAGIEKEVIFAQLINHQGIIQLAQGKIHDAISNWQEAKVIYQNLEDELGIIRISINLASAFKNLGLYHRAFNILEAIEPILFAQTDSSLKSAGLRSYGDILRLLGKNNQAETVLTESLAIANKLGVTQEKVKTLLTLGNLSSTTSDNLKNQKYQQALIYYQDSLAICRSSNRCLITTLPLQIHLAQFNLLLKTDDWKQGEELIPKIISKIKLLPNNQTNIYQQINFAYNLIELKQRFPLEHQNHIPSWSKIEVIVSDIVKKANQIQYPKAESYGLGLQGRIAEQQQEWLKAEDLTQRALTLAKNVNLGEISYLWQWQLGRIYHAQQNTKEAINHYSQATEILNNLSQDLVAIDSNIQYSFRQSIEPVYRELIDLLLQPNLDDAQNESGLEIDQDNLQQARDVIESLQLAELHNFFREACLDTKSVQIDQVDRQAAAIYPIILRDRLEIILSLPNQPLQHYTIPVTQSELEQEIEQLRQTLVIRSRRAFYEPAEKLYDWLISPEIEALKANNIKTIVVVPDGMLRNIPLSALYNGEHYLIEDFSVVLTSGLQLLTPRPLTDMELKTLAVGLTQKRQGFSALDFVSQELEAIQTQTDSSILIDEKFTIQALKQKIKLSDYPIVHIATHGQFGSSLDSTFLLAWDNKININQLDNILQGRVPSRKQAIELLVLSACETATGDKWAALGLAGISVRAGARSTLATLWSVNDEATAQIMSNFYGQLAKKQFPRAEALRQAQLSLLNNPWYNHPFYWSPYVLLGNWL